MKKNKLSLLDFLSLVGLSVLACVFLAACGDKNDKGAGGATEETKGIAITDKEVLRRVRSLRVLQSTCMNWTGLILSRRAKVLPERRIAIRVISLFQKST